MAEQAEANLDELAQRYSYVNPHLPSAGVIRRDMSAVIVELSRLRARVNAALELAEAFGDDEYRWLHEPPCYREAREYCLIRAEAYEDAAKRLRHALTEGRR